jgi:nucleoside-diphosphate-sugar epimerase
VLLTGASGFFGSNLVDLVAGGSAPSVELHTLQRRQLPSTSDRAGRLTVHQVDLFDHVAVEAALTAIAPTHLCHLAWLGPETTDRYRSPDNQRWAEASKRLFTAFGRAGGTRLIHLGSCIEYGNAASGPRLETQPLAPDTAYGEAKADLSQYLLADRPAELASATVAVARPFFAYGPHEQQDRLVSSLILALGQGQSVDLTEGLQRRDYLDARDVASALWALLTGDVEGAFNVGSGTAVTVRSIAETIGRATGRSDLLRFGARPDGADTAAEIVADISRITSDTNWRPQIDLEKGIADAIIWWDNRLPTPRMTES